MRTTYYNYDNRNDTTYIHHNSINYQYLPNGYPSQITYVTPTMYWTEITTKATITYDTWTRNE